VEGGVSENKGGDGTEEFINAVAFVITMLSVWFWHTILAWVVR
jgi:hypothetical protein